jgi:hypothetical protein
MIYIICNKEMGMYVCPKLQLPDTIALTYHQLLLLLQICLWIENKG